MHKQLNFTIIFQSQKKIYLCASFFAGFSVFCHPSCTLFTPYLHVMGAPVTSTFHSFFKDICITYDSAFGHAIHFLDESTYFFFSILKTTQFFPAPF